MTIAIARIFRYNEFARDCVDSVGSDTPLDHLTIEYTAHKRVVEVEDKFPIGVHPIPGRFGECTRWGIWFNPRPITQKGTRL